MSIGRVRALRVDELDRLPRTCGRCPLGADRSPALGAGGPANWARAAQHQFGQCGVAYASESAIDGYLLFSPPLHVPRTGPQSGGPRNPDAAVLMTLRVLEGGQGVGRQLVQAAAARMARSRGAVRALEVRGARAGSSCAVPSVDFLEAVGFSIVRDHPVYPQLRLDLSRTVRWRTALAPTLDRLTDWVRPLPPEPAGRGSRMGSG